MTRRAWWLPWLMLLSVGCLRPDRAVVVDLDAAAWSEAVELCYENADSTARQSLQLFVRLDDRFREDSLTLHITTYSPDTLVTSEYHRLVFTERYAPAPLQRVAELPYRRGVRLPRKGCYRFRLAPTRSVEGIEAIGIKTKNE